MVKKGLCNTCNNDVSCCFPRKSPVWQCEEFSDYAPTKAAQNNALAGVKREKTQGQTEDSYLE